MSTDDFTLQKAPFLADEEQHHDARGLWQALKSPRSDKEQARRQYCLLGLNVLLLVLSGAINLSTWWSNVKDGSGLRRCVHETDMKDARSAIEYEERSYTGALLWDIDSKRIVRKPDAEQDFFGPPSAELDALWDDLLRGEFPVMTDEEAQDYLPELKHIPVTGKYHFEPDVFHTLHCVNALRLEISKSLYNSSASHHDDHAGFPEGWDIAHMEHCLDRVRQSVMCHGDLSPSPLYYTEGFGVALGRTGKRTCRKWEPIRAWVDDRDKRGPLLSPL